jgi:hypothetical protein
MKLKILLILTFNILFISVTYASMPTDWYFGRRMSYSDAQSLGLAGNDLFKPTVFLNNPLAKSVSKMTIGLSYSFGFLQERRTKQVYDQFDNSLGELSFAENLFTRGNIGNFSFLYPLNFMNIGIDLKPQYIYDYYFYREFRDDFYAKIGEEKLEVIGTTYNASLMLGKEFADKFGVGAGLNYYFGSRKFSYHDSILNSTPVDAETTGSPSGIGFTVGISAMPIDQLLIHFNYQSGMNLKNWENSISKKYPANYNLSVSYLAAGEIPTKLGLSMQYTDWKVFDSTFQKTIEVGLGIEHTLFNSVAFRYGFRFEPSFAPPSVHQGLVSIGWGFMIGNVQIDVGADVKRRVIGSANVWVSNDNTLQIYQNTGEILIGAKIPIK